MTLRACAMAASARLVAASFSARSASSWERSRRASTCPADTWSPSSASSSTIDRPSMRRSDLSLLARNERAGDEQAVDEFAARGGRDADRRRRRRGRSLGRQGASGAVGRADRQAEGARLLDRRRTGLKRSKAPTARGESDHDGEGAKETGHRDASPPIWPKAPRQRALNNSDARAASTSASRSGSSARRFMRPPT